MQIASLLSAVSMPIQTGAASTLAPGQVVDAVVLAVLDDGLVQLGIPGTSLIAHSTVPLAVGALLQLAVKGAGEGLQLVLLPGAGQAAAPAARSAPAAAEGPAAGSGAGADASVETDVRGANASVSALAASSPTRASQAAGLGELSPAGDPIAAAPSTPAAALTAAVRGAATRQGGLAPLMADLEQLVSAGTRSIPDAVLEAATQLLGLRVAFSETLSGEDVRQAMRQSGLFLEGRLASASEPAEGQAGQGQGAPSRGSPGAASSGSAPGAASDAAPQSADAIGLAAPSADLKAALLALREVARAWFDAAAASDGTPAPEADIQNSNGPWGRFDLGSPARPAPAAVVTTAQDLSGPTGQGQGMPPRGPPGATSSGSTPATASDSAPQPADAVGVAAPSTALHAALPVGREVVRAGFAEADPDAAPAARTDFQNLNGFGVGGPPRPALAVDGAVAQDPSERSEPMGQPPSPPTPPSPSIPPPLPYRGSPTAGQPVAPTSLPAEARPVEVAGQLLRESDAALARHTLLQAASVPDHPSGDGRAAQGQGQHWMFEVPLMTAGGTSVAQFEFGRDGKAASVDGRTVWRARFSVDIEPIGPVHAQVALVGDRAAVTLWAERTESAALLRESTPLLASALKQAELEPGGIQCRSGAPAPPRSPAPAGHFLDRAS